MHTRRAHAPGTHTVHARRTVHARLGPTLEAQLARRADAVHSKPARQRVRANSLTKVALTGGVDRSYLLVVRHAQGRARARKLEASCHLRCTCGDGNWVGLQSFPWSAEATEAAIRTAPEHVMDAMPRGNLTFWHLTSPPNLSS